MRSYIRRKICLPARTYKRGGSGCQNLLVRFLSRAFTVSTFSSYSFILDTHFAKIGCYDNERLRHK